mgnify:CR=1 FL=1
MIYAVLTCISLAVLGSTWFLYRRNLELFLCALIVIASEFFYLLPAFAGFRYLLLPMLVILLVESFLTGKLSMGRYGWWVLGFIFISILGIVVAAIHGQGLMFGIKAAKFIPLVLIYYLIAGRQIDAERFVRYFIAMACVVGIIATVQYFLPGNVVIFPGMPEAMKLARLENPRVTIGQFVISAAAMASFALYARRSGTLYLLVALALFAEVFFIQKTRVLTVGVLLSLFLVYVLSRKLTTLRLSAYLVLTGFIMGVFLVASARIAETEVVRRTHADIVKKKGSFQGRINAYQHYWKEIEKNPLFGRGLLNFNWEGNRDKFLQQEMGIHLSDIGIMHFFVQAGLFGMLWFAFGLLKLWRDVIAHRELLCLSAYVALATLTLPTIDFFLRSDSMFLFAVFLGIFASCLSARHQRLAVVT